MTQSNVRILCVVFLTLGLLGMGTALLAYQSQAEAPPREVATEPAPDTPPARPPTPAEKTQASSPAPQAPVEPMTQIETNQMAFIHSRTVFVFTNRPGFGTHRMPQGDDDTWWKDIVTRPKIDKEKPLQPPEKQPKSARKPHYQFNDATEGESFGIMDGEKVTEQWSVRKVQLVGLLKPKEPVVYLTGKLPDMKEKKEVPTRELDAFEKAALKAIQEGGDRYSQKRGKSLRTMGAIFAGQQCAACHQKGHLLGAFTFQLEREPYKEKPEGATGALPLGPGD